MEYLRTLRTFIEANALELFIASLVLFRLEILCEEIRFRFRNRSKWFLLTLRFAEACCATCLGIIAFFVSWIGIVIVMPFRDPSVGNMFVVVIFLGVIITTFRQAQQLFQLYMEGFSPSQR